MYVKNNVHQARRRFLRQSSVLLGSAMLLPGASMVRAQAVSVQTRRLSDKVLFVKGPDANVLVVDGSEGLILVDGGHASWAAELQGIIAKNFPGRPIRALFNTQWHPEQTGSNLVLGKQGVQIIAHDNTRLWLGTEIWQRWSGRTFKPQPAEALPKTTFFTDGAIRIGNRNVQYGYMRSAHTDGDIWVYFEDEDVLVTGGAINNGRWTEIDWSTGGFIGGFMDGMVSLMTVPTAKTTIIPAMGDPMTLAELRTQNQIYLTVFDRLHGAFIKSESLEEILKDKLTAEYDAQMGDSTKFMTLAFQSIQGHLRDPQNDRLLNIP